MKIWVLSTCIPAETRPIVPGVFGSEAEAVAHFDLMMRAEWETIEPEDEDGTLLEYPGTPQEAHDIMDEYRTDQESGDYFDSEKWGRWALTTHEVSNV
jgi:hypothetical protein